MYPFPLAEVLEIAISARLNTVKLEICDESRARAFLSFRVSRRVVLDAVGVYWSGSPVVNKCQVRAPGLCTIVSMVVHSTQRYVSTHSAPFPVYGFRIMGRSARAMAREL